MLRSSRPELRTALLAIVAALLLSAAALGCDGEVTGPDGGTDGSLDAGADGTTPDTGSDAGNDSGGSDAGNDGGADGSADAGTDAGSSRTSPGCVDGEGIPEGENTFMLDGLNRRYVMRLPINYTRERAWPVILALHGNGGNTGYWDNTGGSRNIRGVVENDAILIIVEAIDNQWRDYDMPASSYAARIEQELVYFEEVLTQARTELCVNEDAIFSMGFSGGGSFSGVLGCRRTDIRAIAVGGSVVYFDEANCVEPAPAAWVAISEGDRSTGRTNYLDFFTDWAGCDATETPEDMCTMYEGCNAETPVTHCRHPGGHAWPDFGVEDAWAFFSQFVD